MEEHYWKYIENSKQNNLKQVRKINIENQLKTNREKYEGKIIADLMDILRENMNGIISHFLDEKV